MPNFTKTSKSCTALLEASWPKTLFDSLSQKRFSSEKLEYLLENIERPLTDLIRDHFNDNNGFSITHSSDGSAAGILELKTGETPMFLALHNDNHALLWSRAFPAQERERLLSLGLVARTVNSVIANLMKVLSEKGKECEDKLTALANLFGLSIEVAYADLEKKLPTISTICKLATLANQGVLSLRIPVGDLMDARSRGGDDAEQELKMIYFTERVVAQIAFPYQLLKLCPRGGVRLPAGVPKQTRSESQALSFFQKPLTVAATVVTASVAAALTFKARQ